MDLASWFLGQLLEVWDDGTSGWANIDDRHYVQWSKYDFGLQVECVSNNYLEGPDRLTASQRSRLRELGLTPPLGDDLPNYWKCFFDREDLEDAAALLAAAVEVYRAVPPRRHEERLPSETEVVAIVPVGSQARELAVLALAGCLTTEPRDRVAVVDLLGVSIDELPTAAPILPLSQVHEAPRGPVVIRDVPSEADPASVLRFAAEVVDGVYTLVEQGRRIFIVGPPLVRGRELVYASALADVATATVLCIADEDPDSTAAIVTDPLLHHAPVSRTVALAVSNHRRSRVLGSCRAIVSVGEDSEVSERELGVLASLAGAGGPPARLDHRVVQALIAPLLQLMSPAIDVFCQRRDPRDMTEVVQRLAELVTGESAQITEELEANVSGLLDHLLWTGLVFEAMDERAYPLEAMVIERSLQAMAQAGISSVRRALAQKRIEDAWHATRRRDRGREVQMMGADGKHVLPGTVCDSKAQLASVLTEWLDNPHDDTIGEPSTYGGRALIHVDIDGRRFHLNGDSKEPGVRRYLDLVDLHGAGLPWHVVANQAGKVNKVAFGDPPEPIPYFYLYASEAAASPYTV